MPQTTPSPADGPQDALWRRLQAHRFDEPADAHPFSARLAQGQGWRPAHTERVLREYRRFLYLSIRLQGRACPSEAVDAAWHAHLLDSSRYFGQFCPQVLGRPLHHHPSRGGGDGARHRDHYAATLRAYEACFGAPPPADLWPAPEHRFAERVRQVSSRTHWVCPKPAWWPQPGAARRGALALRTWALLLCLPVLAAVGCAPRHTGGPLNPLTGPEFLRLYAAALLALVVLSLARALRGRAAQVPLQRRAALGAVDQAYLAGGAVRAVWVAIAAMLQRGELQLGKDGLHWQPLSRPAAGAHVFEQALYAPLARGLTAREALREMALPLDALHTRLYERGLLTHGQRDGRAWALGDRLLVVAWVAVLLWGEARAMQGWSNGYPVGGLLAQMLLCLALMWLFSRQLPPRLTREARALIRAARQQLRRRLDLSLTDPLMPTALALLGVRVLGADAQALRQALSPIDRKDAGSSGCGGSDSGGGDGGGCSGGCGGCG